MYIYIRMYTHIHIYVYTCVNSSCLMRWCTCLAKLAVNSPIFSAQMFPESMLLYIQWKASENVRQRHCRGVVFGCIHEGRSEDSAFGEKKAGVLGDPQIFNVGNQIAARSGILSQDATCIVERDFLATAGTWCELYSRHSCNHQTSPNS